MLEEYHSEAVANEAINTDVELNKAAFKKIFNCCSDIVFRDVQLAGQNRWLIVYLSSLVEEKTIEDHVLKPLINVKPEDESVEKVSAGSTTVASTISDIVRYVLEGHAALFTNGESDALIVKSSGSAAQRSPEEPTSEPVIRGPRDGFIESISTNIALIRKRIKSSRLKTESFKIGRLTQTETVITYIDGIASESMLDEIRKRVTRIQIDGVIDSGYIEEFIEDDPYSLFPQVHSTERPDVVASELLEGRIGILVDTSPFVLIVPMTFWTGLQASEDYYVRWPIATFTRWIRFMFIFFAIFAPSLYVAITTFHQEMIPTNLVLSIASSREPVPFPALVEAFLMEIIFEALREAGIRLPKQIGQAISIVGGLVIGQAAVQAGIISAPVVIIVSITGIATFTIPRYSLASGIRLLRFPMIFIAGTLGLYGVILGFLVILVHITSLRSFGVTYFAPTPFTLVDLKNVLFRAPKWASKHHLQQTAPDNRNREPKG
ncbi:spore germination protein [Cohnella sp. GCM10027633]|uniref:spore germination protein n=1 Tax=unclassified Cohnella TaxID=2636738 RepID=UPI003631BA56